MEIRELQCYRLSKNFSNYNSEICSSDNDFAAVLRNGAHILSLAPNFSSNEENFNIRRSLIKTPEEFLPEIPINFNELDREKFCLLSLDWKLTPNDKSLQGLIYIRQIGFVNPNPPLKPLLGVINNLGWFQLYSKFRYDWTKVIDISSLWINHWTSIWSSHTVMDTFDTMLSKYKYLRLASFTHCEGFTLDENEGSLVLATAAENGTIAFWKIENDSASLLNIIELKIIVHKLHWHCLTEKFGWIIAACSDGSVKIYFCKKNGDEITLTLLHELWKEIDQMVASHLKVRKQGTRSLIVFSKENALLVFALQNNQIASYMHEFDKKIVGLEIMDDSRIFVILSNHQTYNLSIMNEKCVCVPILFITSSNFKKYLVRGVCFSKNKVFCVISLGIARNFDHLLNKEPWYLLLCSTKKEIQFSTVTNLVKEVSLYRAFDYIECFRLSCVKNKTQIDEETMNLMHSCIDEDGKDCYRSMQIVYILSQCCRSSQKMEDLLNIEILFTISNFRYHSSSICDSRRQYYFMQWFKVNLPKLPKLMAECKLIKNILENNDEVSWNVINEKCDICLANIADHSSIKFILCDRGHKVQRCSRSFLPVTLQPHYTCSICHSIILKSEGSRQCVVCDTIL